MADAPPFAPPLARTPPPADAAAVLAAAFRAAPLFLHVLRGPDFVFEFANEAYYRLVGRRDLLGQPAFAVLPEAAAGGFPARLAEVLATGRPFVGRELPVTLARTPDAPPEERRIDLEYLPLADADGRVTRVLGYGTDVTEHVRARQRSEAALAGERAELARANQQLEDQQVELELTNQQLQEQATELEAQTEELQATAAHLEEQVEAADAARRAAEAERVRATGILERMADAYVALDADFRIVAVNAAMARGSGVPRERLLGGVFWDLFPGAVGTAFERHYRAAAAGAEVHFTHDYSDGRLDLVVDVDAYPGAAGADGRLGVAVFWRDVTARARADAERARLLTASEAARAEAEAAYTQAQAAYAEAAAANRAKGEFLATMSHELRTPLNAIGGYAELIELGIHGPVTEAQRAALARIQQSQRHLLGLINEVLDLAKGDAGALRVAREPVPAGDTVDAALALVRPQAAAKGLALSEACGGTSDARYLGDEPRVRQVLVNLLANAVKFTEPGGRVAAGCAVTDVPPRDTGLPAGAPYVALRVEDTGAGIPAAALARIFEPFTQVEDGASPYTRTRAGTGLGLAISRRLARLMGGDLTVESQVGAGSAFTLWLPAPGGADQGDRGADETAAMRSARAARATPGVVRGLGEVGALLRRQVDALVIAYADRMRAEPAVPLARGMRPAELEDHMVTALADLAQTLVIVGEAGTAETGLLADSVAINRVVAERHAVRRFAQGWDLSALRRDYAVLREVLARAVRIDAHAGEADAEAALGILLGFVEQSEARAVAAWHAARAADPDTTPGAGAVTT